MKTTLPPPPDQPPESLDEQTLLAIDEGLRRAGNGRDWTIEQAVDFAEKRRDEWKKIPSDQIA